MTMRRKISLYIADQLVDLDDQSFILFNYQMDDLSNPTIVKNAFSQQITLKGTANNNRIFGHYFKTDRRITNTGGETGTDFNASQKTPFTIYDEMGHILESGYVKLDSISRRGADIQYKVSLYGGLGSFFFSLSYDENGNKRTLASLDYLGTSNPETELNFSITAQAVQDAWARLRQDTSVSPMWDVINFAPAYNGIPDGNFSPDKALVVPSEVGLQDTITEGEGQEAVAYTTRGGYCLVNLAEAQDEWAVKDLRSYLQRPIFSMKAFWNAICNPANNGGYEVDADVVTDFLSFGKYADMWMTLPLISSIGTIQKESGDLSLTMSSSASSGNTIGRFDISGSVPSGTTVVANLNCKIRFNMPSGANAYTQLSNIATQRSGRNTQSKFNVLFLQAVAYGSDNTIVGGSKIKVASPHPGRNVSAMAAACGYVPAWDADYEGVDVSTFNKVSAGVFEIPSELGFTIEAQDAAYYKILVSVYSGLSQSYEGGGGSSPSSRVSYTGDGSTSTPAMYVDYSTNYVATSTYIIQGASGNSISYTTSESLRSGATITKAMLLSTSRTPAEYMLSFCKIFGLYFTYDNDTRKVTILRRNDLYQDETIDLEKRVDLSKGISIKPLVFDAKWYDFILEGVGGAFYDEYQNVEGVPYGIQRVNTGFDFNADSVNLMDSVVFKNACTILARSKYFNMITKIIPDYVYPLSSFVDDGWYIGNELGGLVTLTQVADCLTIKLAVSPGERYKLNTHGGDSGRAWYFLDSNDRIVNMADALWDGLVNLTIPSGVTSLIAQTDIDGRIILTKVGYSAFYPSPFLDKGNTYTLWSPEGDTIETDISCPPDSASVAYYNDDYQGYDVDSSRKLELRTADNKPIDGSDILVFHEGWDHYDYFKLTDDVPAMDVVNDGVPCWLLGAGGTGQDALYVPTFQRYSYGNIHLIEDSLDFGVPRQMDIPGVRYGNGCTIYERGWKKYISDRYDVNTKVMTCRVNFAGIPVTQELLRKFYWYENSFWVLNAIRNYSLTTYDPVECEFVQVQDKSNYLNGQTY